MSQAIEIYLLDDDPVFLQTFSTALKAYLRKRPDDYRFHTYTDGELLISQVKESQRVDLLIADICLNTDTISGIRVAELVRAENPTCGIIYLTNYLEYATEIYNTRPLYFILKEEYQLRIPTAMEMFFLDREEDRDTLAMVSGHTQSVIHLRDLLYCEHVGRRTKLVCIGSELFVSDKIEELSCKLPQKQFVVCHKGYIVNLNYVQSYQRYTARLSTGQELPISRSRYEAFRAAFANFVGKQCTSIIS